MRAPTESPPQATGAPPVVEDPLGDPFADTFTPPPAERAYAGPPGDPTPLETEEPAIEAVLAASDPPEAAPEAVGQLQQAEPQVEVEGPAAPGGLMSTGPDAPAAAGPGPGADGPGGVRLILEDGTLAKPSLDPELEERLRYIVDNIVPPSSPPSEGPGT